MAGQQPSHLQNEQHPNDRITPAATEISAISSESYSPIHNVSTSGSSRSQLSSSNILFKSRLSDVRKKNEMALATKKKRRVCVQWRRKHTSIHYQLYKISAEWTEKEIDQLRARKEMLQSIFCLQDEIISNLSQIVEERERLVVAKNLPH